MNGHAVVSKADWIAARRRLLEEEKAFTRARDALSAARRELPWVRVEKAYAFDTPAGPRTLADLFDGCSQLIVYHFMYGPDWASGCKSCSFWADSYNGIVPHLRARDVTLVAVSRAPLATLQAFAQRLGWTFPWVSSGESDFNYDFDVSFRPGDVANGRATYNFGPTQTTMSDLPGLSVFARDASGAVFHTYSCYARGLDMMNSAYQLLDLAPKGRDEDALPYSMAWVKLHDLYGR